MEQYNKEQFCAFLKKATAGDLDARRELYGFLLECFKKSDVNYDGSVDPLEFDQMIENFAAAFRNHGFQFPPGGAYKSPEERLAARKAMFAKMDINNDGQISLDEWIGFCLSHMSEIAKGV